MSVVAWLVLGMFAGWIAGIATGNRSGVLTYIVLGIVGALLGGFLFSLFGGLAITGINPLSLVVAVIGSGIVVMLYFGISGRRTS